jgi:signal transduction histidine kinase
MLSSLARPGENVEVLNSLIGWFNHNSAELIEEYRQLNARVEHLKGQLEVKNLELEKSLQEREEARAYLLSVLESFNGGVMVLDENLCPTFVNRRLIELAGAIDERRVAHWLGDKVIASLRRGEKAFLPLECEKVVHGPNGVLVPAHFSIAEFAAGRGQNHFVVVFQDVTSLKRLEAEAARTRRLASLGMMASELAHQVKNPLGGIELCASLLKDKTKGDANRLAGEIVGAVRRLSTTLSQLLAFAAEPAVSADVLSISSLMKDLLQECVPLFDDPKWSIVVDIEPDLPAVWGDRGLLVQALVNLIVNAKEAMPNGGRVGLTAQLAPYSTLHGQIHKAVEIAVRDHGTGIAPENRERIFDPFFSTKAQGTGLGLAFAHKIINAHRGAIAIESAPGEGSRFIVSLAAVEELQAAC